MKIDAMKTRTISNPLVGVTFSKTDTDRAVELAHVFYQLPYEMQRQLRRALAHEARRLDDAGEWTTGEMDTTRDNEHQQALLLLYALDCSRAAAAVLT